MNAKHQPDGIEGILDDCTLALTSRTEDDIKITSFDERLMDIPKLKAALNSYITAKMNGVDRAAYTRATKYHLIVLRDTLVEPPIRTVSRVHVAIELLEKELNSLKGGDV